MSAVSAEFSRAPANSAAAAHRTGSSDEPTSNEPDTGEQDAQSKQPGPAGATPTSGADFGPNEWLVDELYQQYQADPGSDDRAWWNFFADYRPQPTEARRSPTQAQGQAPGQRPGVQAAAASGRTAAQTAPAAPGSPAGVPGSAAPPPGGPVSPASQPSQEVPAGRPDGAAADGALRALRLVT